MKNNFEFQNYFPRKHKMDDLYPSELEVLLGGLTILLRDEKDVEKKIMENSNEIKEYVKKEVIPNDISNNSSDVLAKTEDPFNMNQEDAGDGAKENSESHTQNAPPLEEDYTDANDSVKEPLPIVKKLFKQVALICHPDKVKDEKHNKLFLLGRTAQDNNDTLTLLFILSKCSATIILKDDEIADVKETIEKRQLTILKKKETVTYKWNTYSDDVKKRLIKQIIPK